MYKDAWFHIELIIWAFSEYMFDDYLLAMSWKRTPDCQYCVICIGGITWSDIYGITVLLGNCFIGLIQLSPYSKLPCYSE